MEKQLKCRYCACKLSLELSFPLDKASPEIVKVVVGWIYPAPLKKASALLCQACHELAVTAVEALKHVTVELERVEQLRCCIICMSPIVGLPCPVINRRMPRAQQLHYARIFAKLIAPRKLTQRKAVACTGCYAKVMAKNPRRPFVDTLLKRYSSTKDGSDTTEKKLDANLEKQEVETDHIETVENIDVDLSDTSHLSDDNDDIDHVTNTHLLPEETMVTQAIVTNGEKAKVVPATITLPTIKRAPLKVAWCSYSGCNIKKILPIPRLRRQQILNEFKYYLPLKNRMCLEHINAKDFPELPKSKSYKSRFTPKQIEDMVELAGYKPNISDFLAGKFTDEGLVDVLTGVTKETFMKILSTAKLAAINKGSLYLTALLCKLNTGDTYVKLQKVLDLSYRALRKYIFRAKKAVLDHPECIEMLCSELNSKMEYIQKFFQSEDEDPECVMCVPANGVQKLNDEKNGREFQSREIAKASSDPLKFKNRNKSQIVPPTKAQKRLELSAKNCIKITKLSKQIPKLGAPGEKSSNLPKKVVNRPLKKLYIPPKNRLQNEKLVLNDNQPSQRTIQPQLKNRTYSSSPESGDNLGESQVIPDDSNAPEYVEVNPDTDMTVEYLDEFSDDDSICVW